MEMKKFSANQEGLFSSAAAVLVLFTTMVDPLISAVLAITMLISFAVYKFLVKN